MQEWRFLQSLNDPGFHPFPRSIDKVKMHTSSTHDQLKDRRTFAWKVPRHVQEGGELRKSQAAQNLAGGARGRSWHAAAMTRHVCIDTAPTGAWEKRRQPEVMITRHWRPKL